MISTYFFYIIIFYLAFFLSEDGIITEETGFGTLTPLGRFAGNLPVDLQLGLLISHGISLGK